MDLMNYVVYRDFEIVPENKICCLRFPARAFSFDFRWSSFGNNKQMHVKSNMWRIPNVSLLPPLNKHISQTMYFLHVGSILRILIRIDISINLDLTL